MKAISSDSGLYRGGVMCPCCGQLSHAYTSTVIRRAEAPEQIVTKYGHPGKVCTDARDV